MKNDKWKIVFLNSSKAAQLFSVEVPDDLPSRIRARSARYTTARMRSRPAQIESFDRGSILGPAEEVKN